MKPRGRVDLPFTEVFRLHQQGESIGKIGKELQLSPLLISTIIKGHITLSKRDIKQIKLLGLKICSCCKCRVVPLKPFKNVTLTHLCTKCWVEGGICSEEDDYFTSAEEVYPSHCWVRVEI